MKQVTMLALILFASAAGIISLNSRTAGDHNAASGVQHVNDAAYRDGLFLGHLDASVRRRPHLASGRWTADQDRRLFVAAYLRGYREEGADSGRTVFSGTVERQGYDAGVSDGYIQRMALGRFHLNGPEHLKIDLASSVDNESSEIRQTYLLAYSAGYQEGYYGGATVGGDAVHTKRVLEIAP